MRLGDSSSVETTGYVSNATTLTTGSNAIAPSTTYFYILPTSGTFYGRTVLTLLNSVANTWVVDSNIHKSDRTVIVSGTKSLTGELTRIELTIANRTGGSVNIVYEQ